MASQALSRNSLFNLRSGFYADEEFLSYYWTPRAFVVLSRGDASTCKFLSTISVGYCLTLPKNYIYPNVSSVALYRGFLDAAAGNSRDILLRSTHKSTPSSILRQICKCLIPTDSPCLTSMLFISITISGHHMLGTTIPTRTPKTASPTQIFFRRLQRCTASILPSNPPPARH